MGVPGNADLLLLKTAAAAGGYQVSRSLRFSSGDSSYLSRTPASAGNQKTWTISFWVKKSAAGGSNGNHYFSSATSPGSTNPMFVIRDPNDQLDILNNTSGGTTNFRLTTSAVYRDYSAWMHVVLALDTTQATASNRARLYVNGTEVTTFSTATYPAQNTDLDANGAIVHNIGREAARSNYYSNYYLGNVEFIDGLQLTPSSFGETDSTTGQWIPRLYSGSYGSQGWKLTFADNSAATAATLGKDTSGNSNNWTPNNFSVGNTKTIQVGTPSYPSAFTTTGNKTSDQTALSFVYWGGTYTGAATKIFRASDVSVFSTTIDVSGPSLDRYLWYSDDAINWTYIGNLASLSRPYTLSGYKYYATSEGSNSATITVGALPAGNDSLVDTPTSYGTGNSGGDVRGNYATLNPVNSVNSTLANGNLDVTISTGTSTSIAVGSIAVATGKWYWEVVSADTGEIRGMVGVCDVNASSRTYTSANGWGYWSFDGNKYTNNASQAYGATWTNGDVIGVALDMDSGTLTFYKNGVSQGTAYSTGLTGKYIAPALFNPAAASNRIYTCNFGQRPFAYTAPSGFKALCDTNLPAPVVAKSSDYFQTVLYTGNGGSKTVSGLSFSPDLVWIKGRSVGYGHRVFDTVRGTGTLLYTNSTDAAVSQPNANDNFASFDSGGFSLGAGIGLNENNATYVAWCWDAGSSTVTNTQGSITSSVRANASAGFSIVTYSQGANNSTVGHGLGAAPHMIIAKSRTVAGARWDVFHRSLGREGYIYLDGTNAAATYPDYWGSVLPTSTTFGVSLAGNYNNTGNMVAYCFAPVSGYSSFGSYTANGSTDGPFVFCNFRPRWVLIKKSGDASPAENWVLWDAARDSFNTASINALFANLSNAELSGYTTGYLDALSNGFKIRGTWTGVNGSSSTYIYCAFAESPFAYARAR